MRLFEAEDSKVAPFEGLSSKGAYMYSQSVSFLNNGCVAFFLSLEFIVTETFRGQG